MLEEVLSTAEHKMARTVEIFGTDLQSIRTGRASLNLLDRIQLDYYGSPTPINAVANVSASDARMQVIAPWDRSMLAVIEKAILKSDLGVNPTNDGQVIRLVFPQLNEDRRKELVKQVHQRAEEARVAVRNCRRDAMDHLKKADTNGEVSKEDAHRAQDKLQKLTDQQIRRVDEVAKRKETEVMEV